MNSQYLGHIETHPTLRGHSGFDFVPYNAFLTGFLALALTLFPAYIVLLAVGCP